MEAGAGRVKLVRPTDGDEVFLGSIGVRFLIDGAEVGERFAFLEHPMSPRALAGPLHRHSREDEYSFVLEGRMGALLGDEVVEAGPGELVFKPRNQWHTFWNAGDEPCRVLEIISPAGFEQYFRDLAALGGPLGRAQSSSPSSSSDTGSSHGRRRFPNCCSGSGCAWASRSPAAGRPDQLLAEQEVRLIQSMCARLPLQRRLQVLLQPGGRTYEKSCADLPKEVVSSRSSVAPSFCARRTD